MHTLPRDVRTGTMVRVNDPCPSPAGEWADTITCAQLTHALRPAHNNTQVLHLIPLRSFVRQGRVRSTLLLLSLT